MVTLPFKKLYLQRRNDKRLQQWILGGLGCEESPHNCRKLTDRSLLKCEQLFLRELRPQSVVHSFAYISTHPKSLGDHLLPPLHQQYHISSLSLSPLYKHKHIISPLSLSPLHKHKHILYLSLSFAGKMNTRRFPSWARGGLQVRGRKKRAKLCFGKNGNGNGTSTKSSSLQRKLRELLRIVPGSHDGMDIQTLFQSIEDYITLLEAKLTVLRNLATFYGLK